MRYIYHVSEEETDHFGDLDIDRRIILQHILGTTSFMVVDGTSLSQDMVHGWHTLTL
jgi:hypothetical protein